MTSRAVFCIVIREIVKLLIATDYLELGLSALFSQAAQVCEFFFLGVSAMIDELNCLDQRRAPIYEALQTFRQMRVVPFDVPGHKHGRGNPEMTAFLGEKCVQIDVNSMKPLDNLCHPVSVIKEAEDLAADAFGAAHAFLMAKKT